VLEAEVHAPLGHQRDGVVDVAVLRPRQGDDQPRSSSGGFLLKLAQRRRRRLHQRWTQNEILWRVPDKHQLRKHHQVGPDRGGVLARMPHECGVASHVADRWIYLREEDREPHSVRIPRQLRRGRAEARAGERWRDGRRDDLQATGETHRETARRVIAETRKARRKALARKPRATVRNGVPLLPRRPGLLFASAARFFERSGPAVKISIDPALRIDEPIELLLDAVQPSIYAFQPSIQAFQPSIHALKPGMHALKRGMHALKRGMHPLKPGTHFGTQLCSKRIEPKLDVLALLGEVFVDFGEAPVDVGETPVDFGERASDLVDLATKCVHVVVCHPPSPDREDRSRRMRA
jgi:hypothetical protein